MLAPFEDRRLRIGVRGDDDGQPGVGGRRDPGLPSRPDRRRGRTGHQHRVDRGPVPQRLLSPYAISKHGVIGLTRALAVELGAQGVTANCVCPGPILTGMTDGIPEEARDRFASPPRPRGTLRPPRRGGIHGHRPRRPGGVVHQRRGDPRRRRHDRRNVRIVMRGRRNLWAIAATLTAVAVVTVACGGGGSGDDGDQRWQRR